MSTKRIALVTGATRGLGLAIAEMLIKEEITVIGTSRTKSNALDVASDLSNDTTQMFGMELDVTKKESITAFLTELEDEFPSPSILINLSAVNRTSHI